MAYGSNYTVVVVDTRNIQVVQCLDKHKSMVKKVLWGVDYLRQDKLTQHPPRLYGGIDLVSADATGHIIVWDVTSGQSVRVLQDGTKPITGKLNIILLPAVAMIFLFKFKKFFLDMHWVSLWNDHSHILAALHPPHSFILWDTRTGNKIWKKNYMENIIAFNFDPFHSSKMACKINFFFLIFFYKII